MQMVLYLTLIAYIHNSDSGLGWTECDSTNRIAEVAKERMVTLQNTVPHYGDCYINRGHS